MSALPEHRRITPEAYIALEREAHIKHVYYNGEIFAMTGASRRHNLIVGNIAASFVFQLRGRPCESYASDMRVRVSRRHYTYPDVVVACDPVFEDGELDTLLNPILIVEVLSPSTQKYDLSEKSDEYRGLESLQEYLIVAQDQVRVAHYHRQANGQWAVTDYKDLTQRISLTSLGCTLTTADIYDKVTFDPPPEIE